MPAALRPYVTAGVALVGAGVITVTPVQPASTPERVVSQDYSLTAASTVTCVPGYASSLCGEPTSADPGLPADLTGAAVFGSGPSLFYVPVNLVNALLSVPAWEIQAMDRLADAMNATGSWQVWSPTNVFGFDEQDPPKLQAFIDMLMPFKPFSSALGEELSWWARANLPMNSGCAALPGACPDLGALLDSMFKVPMSQLYDGYTFPEAGEEGSTNPFTGEPVSWAGATPDLEPFGPFTASWAYLTAPPTGVETVPLSDYLTVPLKFGKSMFDAFYPFVQNSEWYNDDQTAFAPLFRALAPILCPSCDPDDPYDNPWLYENYPPNQQAGLEATADSADAGTLALSAAAPDTVTANTESPAGGEENSETSDPVKAAVTGLMKKFDFAKRTPEPTADSAPLASADVAESAADVVADAGDQAGTGDAGTDQGAGAEPTPSADNADNADNAEDSDEEGAGKHRRSDGDHSATVKSIRDKLNSARSDSDGGEEKTDTGSSENESSDTGSSDKGSSDKGSADEGSSGGGADE